VSDRAVSDRAVRNGAAASNVTSRAAMVAIETATETVGVAVRTPVGVEAEFALTGRRRHVETLTPALEHLLAQVDLVPADLGVVAVDVGPGLFTGLRVGVAAAKALAQSLGIGVLGATSLDILTAAAREAGHGGPVLACVDARRGEVFASVRELDAGGTGVAELVAPGLFTPAGLVAAMRALSGRGVAAVGDGARRYAEALGAVSGLALVTPGLSFPPPVTLLRLAATRLDEGEPPVEPGFVVPLYMREADARSNFARVERM
jgi:tRNA threonylcarbamoyladenosine biosynthesis protein TsaB